MDESGLSIIKIPRYVLDRLIYDGTFGLYRLRNAPEEMVLQPRDLDDATKDILFAGLFAVYVSLVCFLYYGFSTNPSYNAIFDILILITSFVVINKVIDYYTVNKYVVYHLNCIEKSELISNCIEKIFIALTILRFIKMVVDIITYK